MIKLKGSEVKNFDINEVTDTTYYEETNVTDTIEIIDVGKVTASVDENSYLEFDTTIGEVIASSYVGNDLQTMYSFNDIAIEMKIDVIEGGDIRDVALADLQVFQVLHLSDGGNIHIGLFLTPLPDVE